MTRLFLVGYMGVGKTTIGRRMAKEQGLTFYDLDWYIATRKRTTIEKLFDTLGEEGFRQLEYNMLHEVGEFENVVVSCGGGTPCFFDNMDYMNQQGETYYVKASPDYIFHRLSQSKNKRPLLRGKNEDELREFISTHLAEREKYYNKAKKIIDINEKNLDNN